MFTKYASGAEVEIEEVYRFESGAEVEADGVYAVKNGAEEQVWTAIQKMKELANTFTVASGSYSSGSSYDGDMWSIFADKEEGGYGTWYLEGDFTDPTISFNWDGCYWGTNTSGEQQYAPAGVVTLYTRTTDGIEAYPSAVPALGNSSGNEEGVYSTQLSGNYDRIGFKISLHDWGLSEPMLYWINLYNILIDGKQSLPGEDCFFNV